MTIDEWERIKNSHSSAIIAPAGHGKTEMITEIVEKTSGKSLLLTHTNAGVDAINKRMAKKGISNEKYKVETIASFCIRWCSAYFNSSDINLNLSPYSQDKNEVKQYYDQYYTGAKQLFQNAWAGNILKITYSRIVVDEYQDCTIKHHEIFKMLENYLPLTVLGDPMQGIFGFADSLVDWNNLGFPIIDIQTYPWRWKKTNPDLGRYLTTVRNQLLPNLSGRKCTIDLSYNPNVCVISPKSFNMYLLLDELKVFNSVIYVTKWENQQIDMCTRLGGLFQNDEKQECPELFKFAQKFDQYQECKLAISALLFIKECATNVTTDLKSYFERLKNNSSDFSRITKHQDIGQLIKKVCLSSSLTDVYNLIYSFKDNTSFKIYRKELYHEMLRSIRYAQEHDDTVFDSAYHVRKDVHLQRRYTQFKYLSSRTLLSKGLEFDCVIIDMKDKLSAKDFYVAMTRAMKKIYVISSSDKICFNK